MNPSTPRNAAAQHQIAIVILFVLLMAATRSHHVAGLHNLPDASWAVFFLAGQHVRRGIVFALLAVLATAIDAIAIGWGGVSDYCVTPAYAMLLPTYAALWLGGRWVARRMADGRAALPTLVLAVGASATIAELCSSGGFYFFGGRYAEPTLAEFLPRLVNYFPSMLGAMALYVAVATLLHAFVIHRTRTSAARAE